MQLQDAKLHKTYEISKIATSDQELEYFLFTLGCYEGGEIEVINKLQNIIIVLINGARYSIDINLANSITLI